MNPHLEFLLSTIYDGSDLHPEHLVDLRKSGLTDETASIHKLRSIPPHLIDVLLGFRAPKVRSAYLIPFPHPHGGWMDHVKMKVFSDAGADDVRADHVEEQRERWRYNCGQRKYLVRRQSAPRLYFPILTMARALEGNEALWVVEGEKKALAVCQLGLPAVGIESAWGWHEKGTRALLPDFGMINLGHRVVEVVPDSDALTNPMIGRAMRQLGDALRSAGGHPRLVRLPEVIPA